VINLSSFIGFHARRTPDRCALKYGVLGDYVRKVDAEHETMIWTHPGMTTYYRNKSGRVFSAMPWRFVDYWAMTHDADLDRYRLTEA
jgi:4-hydroxyacetophenone monooxygenase